MLCSLEESIPEVCLPFRLGSGLGLGLGSGFRVAVTVGDRISQLAHVMHAHRSLLVRARALAATPGPKAKPKPKADEPLRGLGRCAPPGVACVRCSRRCRPSTGATSSLTLALALTLSLALTLALALSLSLTLTLTLFGPVLEPQL